jgi:uncharacterized protein YndB with AHSA1/START domain
MAQTDTNTSAADRESVHARVLNASREQVVRAFREPVYFAQWWGPKGFRSTIQSFDFRQGGHLRLTLHGPDGADYENEYVVEEIVERERIVISHPHPGHYFQLFITLAEEGEDKTRLSWRQRFDTREHFERVTVTTENAAGEILTALRLVFRRRAQPIVALFKLATAFTHPRRIEVFRAVKRGADSFGKLQTATHISARALSRHLAKLEARGFVKSELALYAVINQAHPFGRV